MIANTWRYLTKKLSGPDQTAPPLVGPDRNPSVTQFHHQPLFRVYDPNMLYHGAPLGTYGPHPKPLCPNGPGGPQNYNADCARQPQATWNRASDGKQTLEFFRRLMNSTGLEHI
jgi:hypothetical protein